MPSYGPFADAPFDPDHLTAMASAFASKFVNVRPRFCV
jgi:hypothetical protein